LSAQPVRRRVSGWVIGLLLGLSLLGNVLLGTALHSAFAKLHWARLFPLGFVPSSAPEPAPAPAPAQTGGVVFWGDSRAHTWAQSGVGSGLEPANQAHGATTSSQLRLWLAQVPAGPRARVAVVQIGINDLHPLGALASQQEAVRRQLQHNLQAIQALLLLRSDHVVLSTLLPPAPVPLFRQTVWHRATLQHIAEANQRIRSAADGQRVWVLDAHALLSGPDGYLLPRYVDPDFFLHLNSAGYVRLNEALAPLLCKLGCCSQPALP
jgi:lysophospholipase L1-like esterase